MRLAQRLGYASTDAMLAEMTVDEFEEHRAVYEDDPWDGARLDYGFAMLGAMLANMFRGKGQAAVMPSSLMPRFGPRPEMPRLTAAEEAALGMAWVRSVGGVVATACG